MVTKKSTKGNFQNIVITLLVVNLIISTIAVIGAFSINKTTIKDSIMEVEAWRVGGEDNFNLLKKFYDSDSYKNQQKTALQKAVWQDPTAAPTTEVKLPEPSKDIMKKMKDIRKDAHIEWNPNARFTILEYSEFHCPYCQRHHNQETIKQTMEKFDGQVNTIFRHFIVHPSANKFGQAAECAVEQQGDEWYLTFVHEAFQVYPINEDGLKTVTAKLGLDEDALTACIEAGTYKNLIQDQINEGREFGITGTPGNVIVDNETGRYVVIAGAHPLSKFEQEINNLLNAE